MYTTLFILLKEYIVKKLSAPTISFIQASVILLFQFDAVSLRDVIVNKNIDEALIIKVNLQLKKTRKWTMNKDTMENYSL